MKKTILLSMLISIVMLSCNKQNDENQTEDKASQSTEMMQNKQHQKKNKKGSQSKKMHQKQKRKQMHKNADLGNAWVDEIQMNKNKRWKANPETNQGVKNMLSSIESAELKTLEDYHQLASKLNEEKNFVVKKCTMEGPSHDNLHVFLHPLIEKIAALQKTTTVEESAEIIESIKDNLNKYYNYFK
ncbi:hypothetical protein [Psychroflexus halocasei]|uniref:Lipoprotein n=1 Tax=Psychroflexus halocasei TaxID=908615 RepID=A0A1H4AHW8_9FLAO|nr:hypothetical protein [Psychroflexus halocasei]SEA35515.1 hypothetical protein SAMN05421540_10542 [Psychroflexus halocasei]